MSDGQHRGGGTEQGGVADDDLELTVTRGRRARRAADAPVDAIAPGGAPGGAPDAPQDAPVTAPVTSPPPRPAPSYSSLPPVPTVSSSEPTRASSVAASPPAAATASSPPAPASSAPVAPTWSSAPTALTTSRLGWEPGAPRLGEGGEAVETAPKRPLGSEIGVLPELEHREEKKRPLWRHPAFLVSGVLTVLAVGVGATLMILSVTSAGPPQVTALTVAAGEGNIRLDWDGPDVPYDLYAVASDGAATDLTQLVRGTEAWIPRAGGLVTDDSCFVVRAAESTAGEPVSLEPADLGDQSAQSVCVADAG